MGGILFMNYNLIGELKKNIQDFSEYLSLNRQRKNQIQYLTKDTKYSFSQSDMLALIDSYMSSEFENGNKDPEDGKERRFLNKLRFVRDVARMRTDIDVRNFIFLPENFEDVAGSYLEQKQFRLWVKDNYYGELLNRSQDDYITYGTAVQKRIGNKLVRVPLKNLINTQSAESLKSAAMDGGYVIEVNKMSLAKMKRMKNWDTKDFEHGKEYTIYERYSLVPKYIIEQYEKGKPLNGILSDDDQERVLAMQVLTTDIVDVSTGEGKVLFMQEISEKDFPYEDVFFEKDDGRWLGIGPVEANLENQRALNMNANLRRRALISSSKHIYQTQSEEVAKNLVSNVKDGQVLYVGMTGGITPIAVETRNLAEFGADGQVWGDNLQQMSFTFESATGESMPSGTPFRLGVVLSNAVDSYFSLKREQYGLFLKRVFFNLIVPVFEKEIGDHVVRIGQSEAGADILRELVIQKKIHKEATNQLLNVRIPDIEGIMAQVRSGVENSKYLFFPVLKDWYKNIKNHLDLDLTGESIDESQKETLATLYRILSQKGDPRAERLLEFMLAKNGINLSGVAGKQMVQPEQMMQPGQPGQVPQQSQGNILQQAKELIKI